MNLSYEKLLAILNQLPIEDGKYVLAFVLNTERKFIAARERMLDAQEEYEREANYMRKKRRAS